MKVFVPMDENGQPLPAGAKTATQDYGNRRRYTRHRFSAQVEIRRKPGLNVDAMMFELSEGGMSAATPNILAIGETVEIDTVAGQTAKAIVRRKHGAMYGFEFVGLSEDFRERIRNICRGLPLFTSMLDV